MRPWRRRLPAFSDERQIKCHATGQKGAATDMEVSSNFFRMNTCSIKAQIAAWSLQETPLPRAYWAEVAMRRFSSKRPAGEKGRLQLLLNREKLPFQQLPIDDALKDDLANGLFSLGAEQRHLSHKQPASLADTR